MARSEIARLDAAGGQKTWNYTSGFFAYSLQQLGGEEGDASLRKYGDDLIDSCIAPDGAIRGFDASECNLDQILPGRALLALYERTGSTRLKRAIGSLRAQLSRQPRTPDGGFWHKLKYPGQMWLDGLYMAGPFLARYGTDFGDASATADAGRQLLIADRHLYDPGTFLYYHGWDSTGSRPWSSRDGGHSASFWGRGIGWYAMALVDEIGEMANQQEKQHLLAVLQRAVAGIARWQDPKTGVWWQVVDKGGRPGNYQESSASCMFVYALAKAVREGLIPREPYAAAAMRGYAGIIREFVREAADGTPSILNCCAVAGLNNRNAHGRVRDGTFDYYVSEPQDQNDLKAVSAFILAGPELQRMFAPGRSTP